MPIHGPLDPPPPRTQKTALLIGEGIMMSFLDATWVSCSWPPNPIILCKGCFKREGRRHAYAGVDNKVRQMATSATADIQNLLPVFIVIWCIRNSNDVLYSNNKECFWFFEVDLDRFERFPRVNLSDNTPVSDHCAVIYDVIISSTDSLCSYYEILLKQLHTLLPTNS